MVSRPCKAVIFDLDGTLVDTLGDIAASMNAALAGRGYPTHARDEYRGLVGWGLRALAASALPPEARDEATVEACYAAALAAYLEKPTVHTRPYPGVRELLAALASRGIPCAVLSNKADAVVRVVVDSVLSAHAFCAVRGERPGIPHKPDPTSALDVASCLGADPREVLYLGDSGVDMKTARAAGFFAVGASWGFRDREELVRDGAEVVIDHPLELLRLLDAGRGID